MRVFRNGIVGLVMVVIVAEVRDLQAQKNDPLISTDRVNELLEPIRAKHELPALGAAVVHEGRVVAIGAVGTRKLGDPTEVTVDDLWHIGSCTKAMTATLIAVLIQDGKLRWDSTIGEVLRSRIKEIHPEYAKVTVEQLLQHRGGTPGDPPHELWARMWAHSGSPREQRLAFIEGIVKSAPGYTPGSRFEYSNAGYTIAGTMAEVVMDKPYEELITEMVFKPLGMNQTGFGPPGSEGKVDQPWGHRSKGGKAVAIAPGKSADNPSCIAPAGKVHLTLEDWARFVTVHNGAPVTAGSILTAESLKRMHTPPAGEEYAAGWIVTHRGWAKGQALTHAGSNTMWYAVCWLAPERQLAFLVVTNFAGKPVAPAATDEATVVLLEAFEKSQR